MSSTIIDPQDVSEADLDQINTANKVKRRTKDKREVVVLGDKDGVGEGLDNLEYDAMLAALNAKIRDAESGIRRIEEDNGIFANTRATWKGSDDEDGREKLNILEVFAVEIEN